MGPSWMLALLMAAPPLEGAPGIGEQLVLRWQAPEGCPSADDVRVQIDHYLSRQEYADLERIEITGRVTPTDEGYQLDLSIRGPEFADTRTVNAASCAPLDRAAGLVISVALDPVRVAELVEARRAAQPEPALEPVEEQPLTPQPGRGPYGLLGAGGGVTAGDLPRTGGQVFLVGGARWGKPRIAPGIAAGFEAGAFYLTPRELRPFEDAPEAGARVQVIGGHVAGCVAPETGRASLPLCVGIESAALHGQGIGLEEPRTSVEPWVAGRAQLGLDVRIAGHLWLGLQTTIAIAAFETEMFIGDLGQVFDTGRVSGRVSGLLQWRFGAANRQGPPPAPR